MECILRHSVLSAQIDGVHTEALCESAQIDEVHTEALCESAQIDEVHTEALCVKCTDR